MTWPAPLTAAALAIQLVAASGCSWFEVDEGTGPIDAAPAGESGRLAVPELGAGDEFGSAVAAAPDLLAIGAPGDDREGSEAGAVHFFRPAPGGDGWTEDGVLTATGARTGDRFGNSLALSGDLLAIGAPGRDDDGSEAGAVFLYRRDGAAWQEVAVLGAPDATIGAHFGSSVGFVAAGEMAIGASGHDGDGAGAGAIYLFRRDAEAWLPVR